ncbi:DUF669 domain-containing protein [Caproiciproducens sp.]|uniref:DUF669 domain-containing protein n=1 Tax=Caproiciproducens sp. TaxID=1954376 RepID=UPI002899E751|nr:DUF669 domain-containing protein [Caproiciproducens sp.]
MAYSVNYDEAAEGPDLIPEGEYECIIKYAGEAATNGGTVYMGVTFVIRNDIDQPCKNKYIWHHIWQKKEPTPADQQCSGYSSKQINAVSKAAKLPNGKKYESLSDWADELKNKIVRVTVEHDEYQGKVSAKVKWVNETKFPTCNHRWKNANTDISADDEPAPEQQGFTEVKNASDDDLPF